MVYYHQNLIRRTLGLTFCMRTSIFAWTCKNWSWLAATFELLVGPIGMPVQNFAHSCEITFLFACNFFLFYPNLHNHSKFRMMIQNCHILIFKFFSHSSKLFSSIPIWLSLFNSRIGYKPIFIVENMNQIPQISCSMIPKFPQIQPPIFHYKFS